MCRIATLAGFFLVMLLLVAGCGDGRKTVNIIVLKDSVPLPGVELVFFADEAQFASGFTDADGMTTILALPGEYKVTASRRGKLSETIIDPKDAPKMMMAASKEPKDKAAAPKKAKIEGLAEEYGKLDMTPLSLMVPATSNPVELSVKGP